MTIPAVMFIEMAMDSLKVLPSNVIASELKEFHSLGPARMDESAQGSVGPMAPLTPEAMVAMGAGYLLGLETARAVLSLQPNAIRAGVNF